MVRTQITFRPEQLKRARRKATELGISLAEYVRRLVDRDLSDELPERFDVTRLFALGDSGGSHIARHKDDYVGEAVGERRTKNR